MTRDTNHVVTARLAHLPREISRSARTSSPSMLQSSNQCGAVATDFLYGLVLLLMHELTLSRVVVDLG